MNIKFLTGDINWTEYGGKFITKKLNNGEFDYWLVISFSNWEDLTSEECDSKYLVSINAVTSQQEDKTVRDAMYSYGLENEKENLTGLRLIECLESNGIFAPLKHFEGNNARKLLKMARDECELIESLFGFYMDQKVNIIGNNGWDFIKGKVGFKE